MEDPQEQNLPIKLDYATPPAKVVTTNVKTVPTILAERLTWGVGLGILVSAVCMIGFADDGGPSGGMCLLTSPIALIYTYLSARAGGWDLNIPRTSRTNLAIRAAFLFGFLLPTLILAAGGLLERFQVSDTTVHAVSICSFASVLTGPFLSVVILVRWSLSPNHLPNQRDHE